MLLKVILNVLKPSLNSLTLFAVLTFICIGGVIQTYAFIDNVSGIPKPPLYDELSYFNLWFPWILFAFPLHVIGGIFRLQGLMSLFPEISEGFKLPVGSIVYAYIISSWTVFCWDKWFKHSKYRNYLMLPAFVLAILFNPPFAITELSLKELSFMVSGFIFTALVILIYTISIHGFLKALPLIQVKTKNTKQYEVFNLNG